jgi:hypothetical protein
VENIIIDEGRIYEVNNRETVIEYILGPNVWPFKAAVKLIIYERLYCAPAEIRTEHLPNMTQPARSHGFDKARRINIYRYSACDAM